MTSYEILKYDDCYIELICECPCETKEQLNKKEGETIRAMNCANKVIPCRTDREYYQDNREHLLEQKREYAIENKEEIAEYQRNYAINHKQERKEYLANYYQLNKEEHSKKAKEYRENNREKLKEQAKKKYNKPETQAQIKKRASIKYTCEICNKEVALCKKARHETCKEHLMKCDPEKIKKYQEECGCGSLYMIVDKKRHLNSKTHLKWIETQN
jgi:hypothetical protein